MKKANTDCMSWEKEKTNFHPVTWPPTSSTKPCEACEIYPFFMLSAPQEPSTESTTIHNWICLTLSERSEHKR